MGIGKVHVWHLSLLLLLAAIYWSVSCLLFLAFSTTSEGKHKEEITYYLISEMAIEMSFADTC